MAHLKWGFPLYTEFSRSQYYRDKGLQDFLARELTIKNTEKILDVGCGIGVLSKILAPLLETGQIEGVDLDATLVGFGMRQNKDPKIHLTQGDARKLEFPSGTFDIVTSMGLFENIVSEDTEPVLHEMLRMLKPQGKLVVVQLDMLHYVSLPEEEQFGRFWRDLLAGMRGLGVDLELAQFLRVCGNNGMQLKKSSYEFIFSSLITEKFLSFYLKGLKSIPIPTEIIGECIEFNYQFVKKFGWTVGKLRELFARSYSAEVQEQFLVDRMGSEFRKSLPIHLYVFDRTFHSKS